MDFISNARACALILVVSLAAAAPVRASAVHTQTFAAVKTPAPPPPDASLDAPIWKSALAVTDFYDFNSRQPARHVTVARVLYDDTYLYIGIHAEQRGIPISASQTIDNAGLGHDDRVIVQIDTSGTGIRHYEFSATPKGVHNEYSAENARFAPHWSSIANLLPDGGYNILMSIPLADMRTQRTAVQRWRFNVIRVIAATSDVYTWAFEPTQNNLDSELNWPVLDGLRIAARSDRQRPQADVYALASAGPARDVYVAANGDTQAQKSRPVGLDVTYPLTGTLAFVGTANPDFSNVEVDQTTIAPQEFQRNLTEYRPFFTQGKNYINTISGANVNGIAPSLFYTPSIGVFDRGEKLEGTVGNNSIGALDVAGSGFHDNVLGYAFGSPDSTLTARLEGVSANHPGLRDQTIAYSLSRTNPHSGELTMFSAANENGSLVNHVGTAQYVTAAELLQTQRWTNGVVWSDIGPEFRPVDGLIPINDARGLQGFLTYNGSGRAGGPIKSFTVNAVADRFLNRIGAVHDADVIGGLGVTFKDLVSISLSGGATELRSYVNAFPAYTLPQVTRFNLESMAIGYRDGTASPVDLSYSAGPFGTNRVGDQLFVQQLTTSIARVLGSHDAVTLDADGTVERIAGTRASSTDRAPALDSQWLRRVSLTHSFDRDTSLAIGLRTINGLGGFASPGSNLAISFHRRFSNEDQLYVDFGTPAASQTLHRLIIKYVFHTGGETGA
jgi:hypothetical protein